ncbi:EthD domain-containing protein [Agrobacterium vitis]|uniref:EthD domain-containing protein n=1 Tax=Agrobacterium vitis TaxID=373 RepID=UPI0015730498|nr:EthD domain-containing protein [Agrobacterium vitis]NSZ18765.1 EthD domain-containing protein [Agrobacterium vitis]QZO06643.1 EthD domain-containing protein [Agrobacterium vitis]UJL90095.1 EthD domain-containing protein [Agrobacterium vitis]
MTIKLLICGRRRLGQTLAEHRTHMKDHHGKLVLDYIAHDPVKAPKRYVQNHAFDGVYFGGEPQGKALAIGVDFVTEVWAEDLADLKASRETPFYLQNLKPDEPEMVDDTTLIGTPCSEETIIPVHPHEGAVKVFLAWFGETLAANAVVDATGTSSHGLLGYCRNTPLFPSPLGAIDEYWLPNEAAGIAFATACRDAINSLRPDDTHFSLTIAREYVLHAG